MGGEIGFWALAVLAAALVGMGKGGLPVVGMLGVPVLALRLPATEAAGLLLPVYIASDAVGVWAYRRAFDRRNLAILVPAAAVGIGFGWATAALVPERAVLALVGLIGAVFAGMMLSRRGPPPAARPARLLPGLVWGAVTGFTSFVSHAGGPPYQVYVLPQRLPKAVFAGTTTICFAAVNLMKLPPYWALGLVSADSLHRAALLVVPASVAVFLGLWLVRRLPERLFFRLVTWALLIVSLRLLWQAAAG
ncbi:sulfite exporter TauE/SafE family protein [Frigidibacter sp. MR17.24]|uniref:sulfite exporter TauE/SafE family protein n=1 Tax=Frigidibacter sp. MR17.24 TaxID=3127345 RepID=UPI003012BBD8